MDDLSRKFRAIDWKGLQKSARKMQASTASALKDMVMTDLENKTRAATADTAWGASHTDLALIAQGTYNRDDYGLIMSIVWQRLSSSRWRCVHKSLHVLTFLVMHGSSRCGEEARTAMPHLRALESYTARENGREVAEGVRTRAAKLCEMLSNPQILEQEREESNRLRGKIIGDGGSTSNTFISYSSGGGMNSSMRHAGFSSDTSYYSDSNRTNTHTTFQGYDEPDEDFGSANGTDPSRRTTKFAYDDDAPKGTFAKRAAAAAQTNTQNVDNLLDESPPTNNFNTPDIDDDDDDDFDPRAPAGTNAAGSGVATTSVPPPHAADADLFNALALVPSNPMSSETSTGGNNFTTNHQQQKMSTSQLVQQLAMAAGSNDITENAAPADMKMNIMTAAGNSAPKSTVKTDNPFTGFDEESTSADNMTSMNAAMENKAQDSTVRKLERKETDPFGDLLSTAKQKGVL